MRQPHKGPGDVSLVMTSRAMACGPSVLLLASVGLAMAAAAPTRAPVPPWAPVWQLNKSTAANVCNRSAFMDVLPGGGDLGEFGMITFDWSNNRASWSAQNPNRCEEDLIAQCNITKASSHRHPGPATKTLVYRGGEMSLNYMTDQAAVMGNLARDPDAVTPFKEFFVAYNNGTTWVCHAGHCADQLIWDFRNATAQDYYVNEVVGGKTFGMRNPLVDGMFLDDIAGLGTELPGLLENLKWTQEQVQAWNAAANQTVTKARALMNQLGGLNWQQLVSMASPTQDTCANGPSAGGSNSGGFQGAPGALRLPRLDFPGLSKMCSVGGSGPAAPVSDVPWFMHVYPGLGVYPNNTDCLPNCPRLPDMDQIIAAFLLARGDHAWLGYEYNGCADATYSPYHNNGGMNYWAPHTWSDVMARDFGVPASGCTRVAPGVFERRFPSGTVRLDCNTWKATFG